MANSHKRKELEEIVGLRIGREMSARTVLFHQSIANLAGVSATDLKCLDYIQRGDDVTAGDLARVTGLTTGAITMVIDRLEKAGLARRERDKADRRKIFIRLRQSPATARIMPIYAALGQEMAQLAARYSTPELETIQDFCVRCIEILRRQTEAIQASAKQ